MSVGVHPVPKFHNEPFLLPIVMLGEHTSVHDFQVHTPLRIDTFIEPSGSNLEATKGIRIRIRSF